MTRLTGILVAASLASAPALAAEGQYYMGAGGGPFDLEQENFAATGFKFDDGDTGYRLFGGMRFSRNFSAEVGYSDGGTASERLGDLVTDGIEADIDLDVSGIDIAFAARLPVGESFYAYAKAGFFSWNADLEGIVREDDGAGGVITTPVRDSDSGQDFLFGGGVGFHFGDSAGLVVEWVSFEAASLDVSYLSGNFIWRF